MRKTAFDPGIEMGGDIVDERVAPFGGVKADHVIAEHAGHQIAVVGQRHHQAGGRPRRVEEKAQTVFKTTITQALAQRHQMVVMHQDQVFRLDQRRHRFGKTGVHPRIAAGKIARDLGQVEPVMEQRPQGAVGETVVIFIYILGFQVDRRGCNPVFALEADMAGKLVGLLARPAEPEAVALAQRRRQRDRKSAPVRAFTRLGSLHPVGNGNQSAHRASLQGRESMPAHWISPTSE